MSTILITGANKGIGNGFVQRYLSRPNTTVIASVREPEAATSRALLQLPTATSSKLHLVQIESTSDTQAAEAISSLSPHGITKIDIVIANAGLYNPAAFQKVATMKPSDLIEHVDVNAAGVVRIFQATLPLLRKSSKPIFMVTSSIGGSISGMEHVPFTLGAYGASKAAANYLTRRIHFENEEIIAFAVHPGLVKTEMGEAAARDFGLAEASTEVKDSVDGLVAKLDKATRESISGKFLSFDETLLTW